MEVKSWNMASQYFMIAIMGGSVTIAFKIIWDWLQIKRKNNGAGTVDASGNLIPVLQQISMSEKLTQTNMLLTQIVNKLHDIHHAHSMLRSDIKQNLSCPLRPEEPIKKGRG